MFSVRDVGSRSAGCDSFPLLHQSCCFLVFFNKELVLIFVRLSFLSFIFPYNIKNICFYSLVIWLSEIISPSTAKVGRTFGRIVRRAPQKKKIDTLAHFNSIFSKEIVDISVDKTIEMFYVYLHHINKTVKLYKINHYANLTQFTCLFAHS